MVPVCCVRIKAIKTLAALRAQSAHANRTDRSSQRRIRADADSSATLHHLPWSQALRGAPVDYVADFQRKCQAEGLKIGHGASPLLHLLIVVSSSWVQEAGDLHDPKNPRNGFLMATATGFAESVFGSGCVVASRLDLDEKGGGGVDVIVAPEAFSKRGGKYLSSRPSLKKIQEKYGRRSACSALQDALAEYLQAHLEPTMQRGKERSCRGKDWLPPEIYAARAELQKEKDSVAKGQAAINEQLMALAAERNILENDRRAWEAEIARQKAQLEAKEAELATQVADLQCFRATLDSEKAAIYSQRRLAEEAVARADDAARASSVIVRAISVGEIIKLNATARTVRLATSDAARRAEILAALKSASAPVLELAVAALELLVKAEATAASIVATAHQRHDDLVSEIEALERNQDSERAEQLERTAALTAAAERDAVTIRDEARRRGYEDGRAQAKRIVDAIPPTLARAVMEFQRGNLILRPEMLGGINVVAAAKSDRGTLALAQAVNRLGLAPVLVAVEEVSGSVEFMQDWEPPRPSPS